MRLISLLMSISIIWWRARILRGEVTGCARRNRETAAKLIFYSFNSFIHDGLKQRIDLLLRDGLRHQETLGKMA